MIFSRESSIFSRLPASLDQGNYRPLGDGRLFEESKCMGELVDTKEDLIRYFDIRREATGAVAGRYRIRKNRGRSRDRQSRALLRPRRRRNDDARAHRSLRMGARGRGKWPSARAQPRTRPRHYRARRANRTVRRAMREHPLRPSRVHPARRRADRCRPYARRGAARTRDDAGQPYR